MSKASDKALSELHATLAETLKMGMGIRDDNGAPIASILSVARQFLKDNHIEVGEMKAGTAIHGLAGLPDFTDDDNVVPMIKRS